MKQAASSPGAVREQMRAMAEGFGDVVAGLRTAGLHETCREPLVRLGTTMLESMTCMSNLASDIAQSREQIVTLQEHAVVQEHQVAELQKDNGTLHAAVGVLQQDNDELKSAVASLQRSQARLTLRAAATRIQEIIVEDALGITRDTMRSAKLYTVEAAGLLLRRWRSGNKGGLSPEIDDHLVDKIAAKIADMQARWAAIVADPNVKAGYEAVVRHGDQTAHSDPADDEDQWADLAAIVDRLYGTEPQLAEQVRAMLRQYVEVRRRATTEPAPPASSTGLEAPPVRAP